MKTNSVTDQRLWESLVAAHDEPQFLQSWAWGLFQEQTGKKVIRLGIKDGGQLRAACQAFVMRHPLGRSSLYVPRGPVIDQHLALPEYTEAFQAMLDGLAEQAKQSNVDFLRLESPFDRRAPTSGLVNNLRKWRICSPHQPAATLLLDLRSMEADLLMGQHQKTRYNLNLARKKGVQVVRSDDMDIFLALSHATAARDRITLHPDGYYQTMLSVLKEHGMAELFTAQFEGKTIAANIVLRYGDTATYLHGASSNEHRNVMAPYLLQWEQIVWAKRSGARWYDFWGVAPSDAGEGHSWAGISRFKRGFGGEERQYVPALELPINPFWYRIVRLGRSLRRQET